ncbi:hypothetical protein [Alteribacillus bidgolensis]|uniref:PAC domain-containing protein n=1 Tax=Alteribacillus bidgolensis TaxID=930129 RepID=A0A1G8MQD5_9BACI|nr:hypothetical protein [Alteribacillus bidgolensis]SDI70076.1 hypothetical protein SAMN05216352_110143 [Alteribacillus bidgolensis]
MQKTPTGKVVMATGVPIFNTEKKIIRVLSFSHDLTEIQKLKEDYEQLHSKIKRYKTEIEELREKETNLDNMVTKSKAMKKIWELVYRVERSEATVVFQVSPTLGKRFCTCLT